LRQPSGFILESIFLLFGCSCNNREKIMPGSNTRTQAKNKKGSKPPHRKSKIGVIETWKEIMNGMSDVDVETALSSYEKSDFALRACFPETGSKIFFDKKPSLGERKTIVYLTYENPRGASGGIRAVAAELPKEMRKYLESEGVDRNFDPEIIRLSPLHTNLITKYDPAALNEVGSCYVPFGGDERILTRIFRTEVAGETWHLFDAEDFFNADGGYGNTDPYIDSREDRSQRDGEGSKLLRDSLFASRAVPEILIALGKTKDLIVHSQDWEFATAALTVKESIAEGRIESAAVLLTLHNPYDHSLGTATLSLISKKTKDEQWPEIKGMGRATVLTRMIPLLDGPVSGVSHQFVKELTQSPQLTGVFTSHQQGAFGYQGLVGIDNGPFLPESKIQRFSDAAIEEAKKRKPKRILAEKLERRSAGLAVLQRYVQDLQLRPDPKRPLFGYLDGGAKGKSLAELEDNVPIFMMPGRLEPGQKGYDVLARFIESVPQGFCKFILTPMSPLAEDPEIKPFMEDLRRLAEARAGDVVIFAHRMEEGFSEAMAAATWSPWPSLYEPFGGANEFYALGTPVVAHAVGGLLQQVVDFNQNPFAATGLLYSENISGFGSGAEIQRQYWDVHQAGPRGRMTVPVYQSHYQSLTLALAQAIALYKHHPEAYGRILSNLHTMYQALSWRKPVEDYLRWYETGCR
jgi:glycogen synthase